MVQIRSLKKSRSNEPESFLEEVYADGLFVLAGEDAAAVLLDHRRLPHRPVAHDNNLNTS